LEEADGDSILDFWTATDKARALARGGRGGRPETLGEALDSYEKDLIARGGSVANAARVRKHLPPELLSKPVAILSARDLRRWRDALARSVKGPTLLRIIKVVRAVLNLAARHDKRIANSDAWRDGLRPADIADSFNVRNVILDDHQVARVVAEAYSISQDFGLYIEVHAATGARSSQIAKLDIVDLQDHGSAPRLMMPPSRKGKKKDRTRKPVPITRGLAVKLRKAASDRPRTAPLLIRADGERWRPENGDHLRRFAAAAKRAGIEASVYALRHSSIVRSILAGVPLRIVADLHDTSTAMLERTYSANISHHADEVARKGLLDLDLTPPTADNVVPLPGRRS
jgi:hypothetical protein